MSHGRGGCGSIFGFVAVLPIAGPGKVARCVWVSIEDTGGQCRLPETARTRGRDGEIIRCLKRYVARELFRHLQQAITDPQHEIPALVQRAA